MSVLSLHIEESTPVEAFLPHGLLAIILLGPPGVGKGTQAGRLSAAYNIPTISTGEILRAEMEAGTPLGLDIQETMTSGNLVSDNIVCEIVQNRIVKQDCAKGFILDGFPRTLAQGHILQEFLRANGIKLRVVISFDAEEDELVRRVLERAAKNPEKKRAEDTEEILRDRLAIFYRETAPLIDFYGQQHLLLKIDGMKTEDIITAEIKDFLDKVIPFK